MLARNASGNIIGLNLFPRVFETNTDYQQLIINSLLSVGEEGLNAVPVPATLVLISLGLVGIGYQQRRKDNVASG